MCLSSPHLLLREAPCGVGASPYRAKAPSLLCGCQQLPALATLGVGGQGRGDLACCFHPRWAGPVTLTMTQPGGRWAAWQPASAAAGAAGPLPAPSVLRVKLSGRKASPSCCGKQTAWDQGQGGCCVGKRRSSWGLRGVGGPALSSAAAVVTLPALPPARGRSVGWLSAALVGGEARRRGHRRRPSPGRDTHREAEGSGDGGWQGESERMR